MALPRMTVGPHNVVAAGLLRQGKFTGFEVRWTSRLGLRHPRDAEDDCRALLASAAAKWENRYLMDPIDAR